MLRLNSNLLHLFISIIQVMSKGQHLQIPIIACMHTHLQIESSLSASPRGTFVVDCTRGLRRGLPWFTANNCLPLHRRFSKYASLLLTCMENTTQTLMLLLLCMPEHTAAHNYITCLDPELVCKQPDDLIIIATSPTC